MDPTTIEALGRSIARHLALENVKLLDPDGLAARLGISRRQVWRLIRQGRLPAGLLVGRHSRRWAWADVEKALRRPRRQRHRTAASEG